MSKILVIAPHPDDELLGAGGMMIKNIKEGNEVYVCVVTKGYPPMFPVERTIQNQSDAKKCHETIGVKETFFLDFPSAQLESVSRFDLNGKILEIVRRIKPDEVYIPHYGDMQKDHRIVAEAAMVAVRPKYFPQVKRVYGYETMSETAWGAPNVQNEFMPNVWMDISDVLEDKLQALRYYTLQMSDFPDARSEQSIKALAQYRGAQMHNYAAEAFMLMREIK